MKLNDGIKDFKILILGLNYYKIYYKKKVFF